jgi:hypothetical protein
LKRAFSYENSLKQRAGDTVVLAVLYKSGNSGSEAAADAWAKAFKPADGEKIQGLPFQVIRHAYDSVDKLKAVVGEKGVDILVVCEGLESDVANIKDFSREKKVLTVGTKEPLVQRGLAIGVFVEGEKHTIVVNLPAASAEGITFSSDLLRLARLIR